MNQKGYSWPETILTLLVIVIIFGTLLPLVSKLTLGLQEKKLAMYAAETAYHGGITYDAYGINNGTRHIDGVDYDWETIESSICVFYKGSDEVIRKCIDYFKS